MTYKIAGKEPANCERLLHLAQPNCYLPTQFSPRRYCLIYNTTSIRSLVALHRSISAALLFDLSALFHANPSPSQSVPYRAPTISDAEQVEQQTPHDSRTRTHFAWLQCWDSRSAKNAACVHC
jgi:hypothetical protein